MIKALIYATATILALTTPFEAEAQTPAKKPEVVATKAPGGSIQTKLSEDIVINKQSTVTREWIALHDPSVPADLVGTPGVTTVYKDRGRSGEYQYEANVSVQAKAGLAAVEVRFLVFDVWGQHVRSLVSDEVADIPAGTTKDVSPEWRVLSENEVSRHYASIAYISRVRTQDGRVFEADTASVVREAQKFSKKFTVADLEPKPESK
jgi:hypothetical protein